MVWLSDYFEAEGGRKGERVYERAESRETREMRTESRESTEQRTERARYIILSTLWHWIFIDTFASSFCSAEKMQKKKNNEAKPLERCDVGKGVDGNPMQIWMSRISFNVNFLLKLPKTPKWKFGILLGNSGTP
jgi:hypothetical protein